MNGNGQNILVIFDGLCSVCCLLKRFVERRENTFKFIPFQKANFGKLPPSVTLSESRRAVQVILPSGEVYSAGRGVAEILKRMSLGWKIAGLFLSLPLVDSLTESGYRFIANNRAILSRIFLLPQQKALCN